MSIILGIDTSSTDLGIGLYRSGKPLASYSRYIGNSHAEHLTPLLTALLSVNDIAPHTITSIAIAQGPGSFTGLRIGMAFVKGFAAGVSARILPVSSLSVLVHAALAVQGEIIAAIDARNNDVYSARFHSDGRTMERLSADTVQTREAFYSELSPDDTVVSDTLGYTRSSVFASLPALKLHIPVEQSPLQRGLICAATGLQFQEKDSMWIHHTDLTPNYLRRPTPEIRRSQKGTVT